MAEYYVMKALNFNVVMTTPISLLYSLCAAADSHSSEIRLAELILNVIIYTYHLMLCYIMLYIVLIILL